MPEQLPTETKAQVAALLSQPNALHCKQYYDQILKPPHGLEVRIDSGNGKGKGVFTNKGFEQHQLLLDEPPLVAGQHACNRRVALVCSQCFQFLGGIEMQLAWCKWAAMCDGTPAYDQRALTAIQQQLPNLPYTEQWQAQHPDRQQGQTSSSSSAAGTDAGSSTAASSTPERQSAMMQFREHANNTNDIFLVAAQAIANTLVRAAAALPAGSSSMEECWEALLAGWQPYHMGWKKPWWQSVACPDDVDDEQAFRQELQDLAEESLNLLKDAIGDDRFPAVFNLEVFGSIIGMFELNNLGIDSPSPVHEYVEAIDDLPETDKAAVQLILQPLLAGMDINTEEAGVEGTAFYALQSCINHSCQPNAHALRSDEDANSNAVILAKHDIPSGTEITISYIDETLLFDERQAALRDYGFICHCPLCQS